MHLIEQYNQMTSYLKNGMHLKGVKPKFLFLRPFMYCNTIFILQAQSLGAAATRKF